MHEVHDIRRRRVPEPVELVGDAENEDIVAVCLEFRKEIGRLGVYLSVNEKEL